LDSIPLNPSEHTSSPLNTLPTIPFSPLPQHVPTPVVNNTHCPDNLVQDIHPDSAPTQILETASDLNHPSSIGSYALDAIGDGYKAPSSPNMIPSSQDIPYPSDSPAVPSEVPTVKMPLKSLASFFDDFLETARSATQMRGDNLGRKDGVFPPRKRRRVARQNQRRNSRNADRCTPHLSPTLPTIASESETINQHFQLRRPQKYEILLSFSPLSTQAAPLVRTC
jgi:hypothetical protein